MIPVCAFSVVFTEDDNLAPSLQIRYTVRLSSRNPPQPRARPSRDAQILRSPHKRSSNHAAVAFLSACLQTSSCTLPGLWTPKVLLGGVQFGLSSRLHIRRLRTQHSNSSHKNARNCHASLDLLSKVFMKAFCERMHCLFAYTGRLTDTRNAHLRRHDNADPSS